MVKEGDTVDRWKGAKVPKTERIVTRAAWRISRIQPIEDKQEWARRAWWLGQLEWSEVDSEGAGGSDWGTDYRPQWWRTKRLWATTIVVKIIDCGHENGADAYFFRACCLECYVFRLEWYKLCQHINGNQTITVLTLCRNSWPPCVSTTVIL